jgi:hypothetical protein
MTPAMTRVPASPTAAGPATVWNGRREARLRPEHAHRYPGIRAGEWEPAAMLADRVLAGALLRERDRTSWRRALLDEHFEFRGGGGRLAPEDGGRPRREDR